MSGSIRGHKKGRGKGSWQVRYELGADPVTGQRRRGSFTVKGTRRDAEQALTDALRKRDTGIEVAPGKITVAEFLERWLRDYAEPNVAPSTFERYAGIVRKWCVPAFGSLPLSKLRPAHLQGAYAEWQGKLSARSVLQHHRVLREALSHAVDWQLLALNPATAAKPPRPEMKDVRFLQGDEVERLLSAVGAFSSPYPALLHLALSTGAREGELLALRWQDVDLDERTLRIGRTVRWFKGVGLVYGEPKTYRSRRPVLLDADTVAILKAHHADQSAMRLRAGPAWEETGLVFTGERGEAIPARTLIGAFRRMARSAGLEKLPFHALRHTHGTLLAAAGVNPRFIADRLGHVNATFTLNTYVHTTRDGARETADLVGRVLRAGSA